MTEPVEATADVAEPDDTGPAWRNWSKADVICGGGLIAGVIWAYVLIGVTPSLLAHHAVLLEAVAGNLASIITGGALARIHRDALWVVLCAPLICIAIFDVFRWWGGRRWGDHLLRHYTTGGSQRRIRWLNRTERMVRKRGWLAVSLAYFLPIPNSFVYLMCGTSGMSLVVFLVADVVGTMLWDGLLVGLGWAIGHPAIRVVNEINHYSLYVTIGLVVVIVFFSVRNARRAYRQTRDNEVSTEHPVTIES